METPVKSKPTFPKLLGKGLMYSLMGAAGVGGLFLLGPTLLPILTSVGLLGAPFGITFLGLSSAIYAAVGAMGLIKNTKDTFIWGKDKIKSVREKISILRQYIKEKQAERAKENTNEKSNENSNKQTNTAEHDVSRESDAHQNKKSKSQDFEAMGIPTYKGHILESFVPVDGRDRKRRAASLRSAASKLRRKEMISRQKTGSLEEKVQEQIQKKQDKLNKQAAKMRGQISKSRANKKLQKERAKLAQVTTARKEQEQQDVKQAVAEAKQRLSVIKDKRNQRIKNLEEAKKRTAARAKVANQNDPIIKKLMKEGTFIARKPTR